ncbi:MAG: alcohol dehydrogenase catalytic domain-containing protein [Pseudomonadota bacterium]
MKALIYEGPRKLAYAKSDKPVPEAHDALVRVAVAGICGSDLHGYVGEDDRRFPPLILGHEVAGVVANGKEAGRRVTINPLITCMECEFCVSGRTNLCDLREVLSVPPRQGGFATYVALPRGNLVTVPDDFSLSQAALVEPIACGWHAARLARRAVPSGRRALVIGGGAIGLGAALSLAAQGVTSVKMYETNPLRADFLRDRCGQTVLGEPNLSEHDGFDLVIDAVGSAASRELSSTHVRTGGVIGHIGLGADRDALDIRRMTLQEVAFIGTYLYTAQDFRQTAAALFEGRLGPADWVETRALSDGANAFADLEAGRVAAPRLQLLPDPA